MQIQLNFESDQDHHLNTKKNNPNFPVSYNYVPFNVFLQILLVGSS